jgi:hypothetical protein
MPNPRYVRVRKEGKIFVAEPTVEFLSRLATAKEVYHTNLNWFCDKHGFCKQDFLDIQGVYLIGSHATDNDWQDETSDLDLKLVNPTALPADLHLYKREVLNPLLCRSPEKKRWIDLYFVHDEYQVMPPRYDVIQHWKDLSIE